MDCITAALGALLGVNLILLVANVVLRWRYPDRRKREKDTSTLATAPIDTRLMVIIGSGGHTLEMLRLLAGLATSAKRRYVHRTYVVATTDSMGEQKACQFEKDHFAQRTTTGSFEVMRLPRSREVGQSYISSVWTTLVASEASFKLLWRARPSLLLCNGPGTGLPLCLLAYLLFVLSDVRVLSRERRCQVVFVESICRVRSLSLTALVLYYTRTVHALLVQWPELQALYPKTSYIGRLV